jgi:ATP-dependent DNA helicase RecG
VIKVTDSAIRNGLPFNLDDLINIRNIEGNRIEFKATWDDQIKEAVVRTVCAFANDLLNLGGGYVVLGVEDEGGRPILPPRGLEGLNLELLQKRVWEACYFIQPSYQPIQFLASYQDKPILVIWAFGGDNRPYEAPEKLTKGSPRHYYVRHGPQTVIAKGTIRQQLLESAAKIPFDDRRHPEARLDDLSPSLVRKFLQDVKSELVTGGQPMREEELYRRIHIIAKVNDHEVPRNVGLLFFSEDPERFFPGARIEVVQFGDDAGGDLIEERAFRGPLNIQVKNTLDYLSSLGGTLLKKIPGQAEVERTVPYPFEAMEEAIVNAVYHRGYDAPPEPIKVYLYPDRMEITSYPGPVPGISGEHFQPGHSIPAVPARNRRLGEFLKELRLAEGRGTGIPKIRRKMKENGSPKARFDFDDARTYFRVILPVRPKRKQMLRENGLPGLEKLLTSISSELKGLKKQVKKLAKKTGAPGRKSKKAGLVGRPKAKGRVLKKQASRSRKAAKK